MDSGKRNYFAAVRIEDEGFVELGFGLSADQDGDQTVERTGGQGTHQGDLHRLLQCRTAAQRRLQGSHRLRIDELSSRTRNDVFRQFFPVHRWSDLHRGDRHSSRFFLCLGLLVEHLSNGRVQPEDIVLAQDRVHVVEQSVSGDLVDQRRGLLIELGVQLLEQQGADLSLVEVEQRSFAH